MTTGSSLAGLSEPKLRAWIVARMRGQEDPPIDESRLEGPDDYVRAVYQEADARFRARIEKAVIAALEEVSAGDLSAGSDARALQHLSALIDGMDLRRAAPRLQRIAEQGVFGGQAGLDPAAEEMVLLALAGLQAPAILWAKWAALWRQDVPRLWPVVTVGLRLSDPSKALAVVPEAVERAASHPEFPLGEVLWAFATDERYTGNEFAGALAGLSASALERCRVVLRELGATPEELDAWVPRPAVTTLPDWARVCSMREVPQFTGAPICR